MKTNTKHWVGIAAGILSLTGYASAAPLSSEKYTYDASGNITSKSIDGVVTKMAYDNTNRLIERQTTGQGKQTTAYDAASRPVTERNADGRATRSMAYGYGDKVLETQTQDFKAGFYYNAEGQLVGKQTDGNVSTYSWDGNVLAAEGADAFTNEAHVTGGVPVLSSGKDVFVTDHLGNTLVQGDAKFCSTAYGEGLEDGRLTGKPFVKELGSFVFHYRFYSSKNARWLTSDPIGFPDGPNGFSYVCSDPINYYDPVGTLTFPDFPIAGAPATKTVTGVEIEISLSPMTVEDRRTAMKAVLEATSATLPTGDQRTITVNTANMTGTAEKEECFATTPTVSLFECGQAHMSIVWKPDANQKTSNEAYMTAQIIDTNDPLRTGQGVNVDWTDALDGAILYPNGFAALTDEPNRPFNSVVSGEDSIQSKGLTVFGGAVASINWKANSCLVLENTTAKTIKLLKDASFGWGFDIHEK